MLLGCALALFAIENFGQVSSSPTAPPLTLQTPTATASPAQDFNTTFLQFETALRQEAKEHREFLKDSLDQLKIIGGGLVVSAGIIFGLLNIKTGRDIRAQVNARFKGTVDAMLNERMEEFDADVEQAKKRVGENTKKIEQIREEQLRLIDRFADFASDLTFAFHVLSEKSTDRVWQAERRASQQQLEARRRDFPTLRRLGILLGRIHKHFGEYDLAINVLTEVMQARDDRQMPQDIDYAALLYNRACYRNRAAEEAQKKHDLANAQVFRKDAWLDLNRSVQIDSNNGPEAFDDKDFETLWNDHDRKKGALGKIDVARLQKKAGPASGSFLKNLFQTRR